MNNLLPPVKAPIPDFTSGETLTVPRMNDLSRGINEAKRALANFYDSESPFIPQSRMTLCRYSSNAPGAGKYWLAEYMPAAGDVDPAVNLNAASFGNISRIVLGLNADEEGGSGHDLNSSNYPQVFPVFKLQYNSTGLLVVVFSASQWKNCTTP